MSTERPLWVLATGNRHKAGEFADLLKEFPVRIEALPDGVELPPETGSTLLANARIKGRAAAERTGQPALADDSGLEVDALGGEPGVYSARYAGDDVTFEDNNRKLLERLTGIHGVNRRARFRCVLVLVSPEGRELVAEGRVDGFILEAPRGEGGFGYDPVFRPEDAERTLAEMTAAEKNQLSHRARAVASLRRSLEVLGRWTP